jgi:hypothetical protein
MALFSFLEGAFGQQVSGDLLDQGDAALGLSGNQEAF